MKRFFFQFQLQKQTWSYKDLGDFIVSGASFTISERKLTKKTRIEPFWDAKGKKDAYFKWTVQCKKKETITIMRKNDKKFENLSEKKNLIYSLRIT